MIATRTLTVRKAPFAPKVQKSRRQLVARADDLGINVINDDIKKDQKKVVDYVTAGSSPDLPSGVTVRPLFLSSPTGFVCLSFERHSSLDVSKVCLLWRLACCGTGCNCCEFLSNWAPFSAPHDEHAQCTRKLAHLGNSELRFIVQTVMCRCWRSKSVRSSELSAFVVGASAGCAGCASTCTSLHDELCMQQIAYGYSASCPAWFDMVSHLVENMFCSCLVERSFLDLLQPCTCIRCARSQKLSISSRTSGDECHNVLLCMLRTHVIARGQGVVEP